MAVSENRLLLQPKPPALASLAQQQSKSDSAIYATNDPYLAAFLLAETRHLLGKRRFSIKRVEYYFQANRELHSLIRTYWRGGAILMRPAALFDAFTYLKSRDSRS